MLLKDAKKAIKAFNKIYDFATFVLVTEEGSWLLGNKVFLENGVVKGDFHNRHTGEIEYYGFSLEVIYGITVINKELGEETHYGLRFPAGNR
jgi:hypothetical protein